MDTVFACVPWVLVGGWLGWMSARLRLQQKRLDQLVAAQKHFLAMVETLAWIRTVAELAGREDEEAAEEPTRQ